MNKKVIFGIAAALVMLAPQGVIAEDDATPAGAKIGTLTCKTVPDSGINLLIHSTTDVKCTFTSSASDKTELYKGETGIGLGVDINIHRDETLSYLVFSADSKQRANQLAGKYVGGGASATVGVGVGVQALVGGNNNSISLQPIVVSSSTGGGVAGGITYLYLEPDK